MATITNPAIIDRLSGCDLYRWRTNVLFGVTWSTEDNHTYWPSMSTSNIVDMENAWGRDRLQHFDLHYDDKIYIAEGQYISSCIGQTCFRVHELIDYMYEQEEQEREREWLEMVRFLREAKPLAQELVSINSLLHVSCQPLSKFPGSPTRS